MSRENNQMAYIAEVTHVFPIPDADAIEKAVINAGWPVVIKKGEFKPGDLCVYMEIDSWVPTEIAPFLSKGKEPREYNGVKGEKLRSIKLRGQRSQGLVLPMSVLSNFESNNDWAPADLCGDFLGIQKWEAPETFTSGNAKGNFPSFVPKTDAERVQNLRRELQSYIDQGFHFEVTEKLHGTSFTAIWCDNELTVCSRNLALKEEEGGTYWNVAKRSMLEEKFLCYAGQNFAVQGEIVGPGILGNQYNANEPVLYVFNVYDIDKKSYMTAAERRNFVDNMGLKQIPFICNMHSIAKTPTIDDILAFAEGKSKLNGSEREGVVFKCIEDPSIQFKAVSNVWLDKEK
jgi:RNA ligase (TIGR02306 family)